MRSRDNSASSIASRRIGRRSGRETASWLSNAKHAYAATSFASTTSSSCDASVRPSVAQTTGHKVELLAYDERPLPAIDTERAKELRQQRSVCLVVLANRVRGLALIHGVEQRQAARDPELCRRQPWRKRGRSTCGGVGGWREADPPRGDLGEKPRERCHPHVLPREHAASACNDEVVHQDRARLGQLHNDACARDLAPPLRHCPARADHLIDFVVNSHEHDVGRLTRGHGGLWIDREHDLEAGTSAQRVVKRVTIQAARLDQPNPNG